MKTPDKRAEPYTKIMVELPVSEDRPAYMLVNNRSEGNAPLTVQALSDSLRG